MADEKELKQQHDEWDAILADVEQQESIPVPRPKRVQKRRKARGTPNNWQLAQERRKRGIVAKEFVPGRGKYPGRSGNSADRRRGRLIIEDDDKTS